MYPIFDENVDSTDFTLRRIASIFNLVHKILIHEESIDRIVVTVHVMMSVTLGSIPIRRFCQKTCSGRPRATTPAGRPFSSSFGTKGEEPLLCRSSLQTTFEHQEEESPLLRCEIVFTMQVCMQEDQFVCVSLNGRQRRNRLCWAREHVSWKQQQWASVLFTDESDLQWRVIQGRLLIWRKQRARYHQSNTVERHCYRVVESWFGQGSRSVATLTCMCSMEEP
ncbi:uncharacterized protein TNCV_4311521 [Trichonephila clavipes]|nr:uncharacterized protein TNCV_4311521 [Trichonephila clavipes]